MKAPIDLYGELLARIAIEVARGLATGDEGTREVIASYSSIERFNPLEILFEFGSDLDVGISCEVAEVLALIEGEDPEVPYFSIVMGGGTCEVWSRDRLLDSGEVGYVGGAFAPIKENGWIYWNPVSWPLGQPRFLT